MDVKNLSNDALTAALGDLLRASLKRNPDDGTRQIHIPPEELYRYEEIRKEIRRRVVVGSMFQVIDSTAKEV